MKYLSFLTAIIICVLVFVISNRSQESENKLAQAIEDQADTNSKVIKSVNASEAREIIDSRKENFKIIDIRTSQEYGAGHIENAELIDFYNPNFEKEIQKLDKTTKYLVYCRSGNRSSQALKLFNKYEFSEVYEMAGGYTSWLAQTK